MADFTIQSLRGGINNTDPAISLPDDQVVDARNVDRSRSTLGARRRGAAAISLTGSAIEAHDMVTFLHRHFVSGDGSDAALWALGVSDIGTFNLQYKDTSWHSPTLKDDIVVTGTNKYKVRAISLHGKIFFAYKSAQDRLHVWDGSTLRRTGLAEPAAPTGANTGAGTLTGTRYYRVRYVELSGTTVLRRSEPSDTLTFAPSTTGLAVRITKPAAISEGETHWELEASIDNSNFYRIARTVVATTTYDDNQDYVTGYAQAFTLSEDVGDYSLIGSVRFLVADQDRLVFAGSHEDADSDSVVGWTPVDNDPGDGNDERVPLDTTNTKNLDGRLGGRVTGMSNPINGYIYVFKNERIYKLVRTGTRTNAYEAVLVTDKRGAVEGSVLEGIDQQGNPCVYFFDAKTGPCRVGIGGVLEAGDDINNTWEAVDDDADLCAVGLLYTRNKQAHWWVATDAVTPDTHLVLQTNETRQSADGIRRGWDIWDGDSAEALCATMYAENIDAGVARSETLKPLIGRRGGGLIWQLDTGADDNGAAYHAYQTTKPFTPVGLLNDVELKGAALLGIAGEGVTVEVTAIADMGLFEKSATADFSPEGSETQVIAAMDDLGLAEMTMMQITFEDATVPTGRWDLQAFAMAEGKGQKTFRGRR